MQLIIRNSKKNYINFIEKALIFFTIITPFFLPFSRFFADFFLSLSGITLIIVAIQKKDFQIFLLKYSKIFFFWFIFLIIISTFAEIKSLAYESTLFYFRYFFYSLSILYCLINFEIFKKYFLLSISISIIILLFDSYFQLLFGINTIGYKYDNTWNRLSSFFADDYVLGSYLARIIPLFVGLIILTKLNLTIKVTVILFSTFTIFIIILFSGDRSGLLYFMLFTILFIFLLNLKIMHKLIILLISVFLILLVMISNNTIYNRMIDYTKNQILIDSKIHPFSIQHQLIYETSLKILKDNYLFGIGPKNYRITCQNYKTFSNLDRSEDGCSTHPHNTYLQLLVETGIIGFTFIFILFLLILYYFVKKIYFVNILNKKNDTLGNDLILISLFISLWPLVPTGSFFNNWLNIIYYLPIGFLIYNNLEIKDEL